MRAFVAIALPEDAAAALAGLQATLPAGRPVPPENLHLTLAFLDDQREDTLAGLDAEFDVLHAARFALELAGIGCFGGDPPKLLVLAARPDPALTDLRRRIAAACRRAGIVLPRDRFRPHVTLARFGRAPVAADLDRLRRFLAAQSRFALPAFPVGWFSLFRSSLHRDGARHEELARYPLG